MSQIMSGAGGAASGAGGPWGAAIGAGVGLLGGLLGKSGAKAAKRAQERRYRQMLDILARQGTATKNDIRAGAVEERAGQVQTAAGRGLYNTSVLDTLQGQSNDREARALAGVDQDVAAKQVGIMNDRTDYASDSGAGNSFAAAGQLAAGLVNGFFPGKSNPQPVQQPGNAVGGVVTAAGKARPYADRLNLMVGAPDVNKVATGLEGAAAVAQPLANLGNRAWDTWKRKMPVRRTYASYANL